MKERNRHILKKAITNLPAFTTNEGIWERVHCALETPGGSELQQSIESLPRFKAPKGNWEQVEKRLDRQNFPRQRWIKLSVAAAVILLIIGSSLIYFQFVESGRDQKQIHTESGLNNSLIYNPALCQGNPEVCNSPVFIELDKQLEAVKKELDLMRPLVENNDPQLLKYYYRLENLRVEIEKRMVKLIIES